MDRRYRDYSQEGVLTAAQMGEALKRLRRMVPGGPKEMVNVDKTACETVRNAGEIEIVSRLGRKSLQCRPSCLVAETCRRSFHIINHLGVFLEKTFVILCKIGGQNEKNAFYLYRDINPADHVDFFIS